MTQIATLVRPTDETSELNPYMVIDSSDLVAALERPPSDSEIKELKQESRRHSKRLRRPVHRRFRYQAKQAALLEGLSGDIPVRVSRGRHLYTFLIDVAGEGPQSFMMARDLRDCLEEATAHYHDLSKGQSRQRRQRSVLRGALIEANTFFAARKYSSELAQEITRFIRRNKPTSEEVTKKIQKLRTQLRVKEFATIIGSSLHMSSGKLCVINGSGMDALLYDRSAEEVERIPSTSVPLGILEEGPLERQYRALLRPTYHDLSEGTMFVSYSDGGPDMVNAERKSFGEKNWQNYIVENLATLPTQGTTRRQLDRVLDATMTKPEGYRVRDDRTIVVLEALE